MSNLIQIDLPGVPQFDPGEVLEVLDGYRNEVANQKILIINVNDFSVSTIDERWNEYDYHYGYFRPGINPENWYTSGRSARPLIRATAQWCAAHILMGAHEIAINELKRLIELQDKSGGYPLFLKRANNDPVDGWLQPDSHAPSPRYKIAPFPSSRVAEAFILAWQQGIIPESIQEPMSLLGLWALEENGKDLTETNLNSRAGLITCLMCGYYASGKSIFLESAMDIFRGMKRYLGWKYLNLYHQENVNDPNHDSIPDYLGVCLRGLFYFLDLLKQDSEEFKEVFEFCVNCFNHLLLGGVAKNIEGDINTNRRPRLIYEEVQDRGLIRPTRWEYREHSYFPWSISSACWLFSTKGWFQKAEEEQLKSMADLGFLKMVEKIGSGYRFSDPQLAMLLATRPSELDHTSSVAMAGQLAGTSTT